MFTPLPLGRYIKGVEYASMTSLLQDFRRHLEHENGGPIHELNEVNAAQLISDLCIFLGLSDQNRRKVLGAQAAMHIDQTMASQFGHTIQHSAADCCPCSALRVELNVGSGDRLSTTSHREVTVWTRHRATLIVLIAV